MRAIQQPVEIRTAEEEDLRACISLDDSYTSTHTWHIEVIRGEPGSMPYNMNMASVSLGDSPLSVTFRPVKLSRARKVLGPIATSIRDNNEAFQVSRIAAWQAANLVLVAHQGSKLCGYLVLTIVPSSGIGWISSLVVANSIRRQGVGSMLMSAARRWSRYGQGSNVRAFMMEATTKNYPAVAFCRKEGFNFCGYTDYSFNSADAVLLFASPVVI